MAFHFPQQNSYNLSLGESPQIPTSTTILFGRLFRAAFNPVQKFRGFPVNWRRHDAVKTGCCLWGEELGAEGWAATRPAGQRHHWPWWDRGWCYGGQGCSSSRMIRQADNQVTLSSSLTLPNWKLHKVLEDIFFFTSLLMVIAVVNGYIVIFFFTFWWELFCFAAHVCSIL